jgi:hypothetical protein
LAPTDCVLGIEFSATANQHTVASGILLHMRASTLVSYSCLSYSCRIRTLSDYPRPLRAEIWLVHGYHESECRLMLYPTATPPRPHQHHHDKHRVFSSLKAHAEHLLSSVSARDYLFGTPENNAAMPLSSQLHRQLKLAIANMLHVASPRGRNLADGFFEEYKVYTPVLCSFYFALVSCSPQGVVARELCRTAESQHLQEAQGFP